MTTRAHAVALLALICVAACSASDSKPLPARELNGAAMAPAPSAELFEFRRRPTDEAWNRLKIEPCVLPAPDPRAEIVAVSVHGGDALSTVAISGMDEETTIVRLNVEPGKTPLYVFVTGYSSIIWKFEGATKRVERVVAQPSEYGAAGVEGIHREKVSFAPVYSCGLPVTWPKDPGARHLKAKLSSALGREITRLVSQSSPSGFQLPSGDAAKPGAGTVHYSRTFQTGKGTFLVRKREVVEIEPGSTDVIAAEFWRFNPGGLILIDPQQVSTSGKAERYDVLPQKAGLLQLALEGALWLSDDGYYVIQKPIARFPADLNGALSVRFLLKKGVPMPSGSLGHSSMLNEETGECMGVTCDLH